MEELLNRLCDIRVDEKLLRSTGAGQVVGKLRNHEDANLAALAKKVVHKWKKDVMASNSRPASSVGLSRPGSGTHTPTSATTKSSNNQQRPGSMDGKSALPATKANGIVSSGKPTGDPAVIRNNSQISGAAATTTTTNTAVRGNGSNTQRTAISDQANIKSTGDSIRDKCAEVLYNSMAIDSNADSSILATRASAIENIEFGKAGSTIPAYRTRIRSLCLNLRDKKNPELRSNIVEGNISIERFCTMTSEEMASKELKNTIDEMKKENLFKAEGVGRTEAETDQFRCGRCKARKCTYYQLQTRSADEPMTTFVTCTQCDNRWKF